VNACNVAFFDIRDGFRRKRARDFAGGAVISAPRGWVLRGDGIGDRPAGGGSAIATASVIVPTTFLATANASAGQNAVGRKYYSCSKSMSWRMAPVAVRKMT
jgi:hypothetical protein